MKEPSQKRDTDFMRLRLGVAAAILVVVGIGLLSQTLQGIPAAIGVIVVLLMTAFFGYALHRLVTEASTQSDQGEAEQERDSSL